MFAQEPRKSPELDAFAHAGLGSSWSPAHQSPVPGIPLALDASAEETSRSSEPHDFAHAGIGAMWSPAQSPIPRRFPALEEIVSYPSTDSDPMWSAIQNSQLVRGSAEFYRASGTYPGLQSAVDLPAVAASNMGHRRGAVSPDTLLSQWEMTAPTSIPLGRSDVTADGTPFLPPVVSFGTGSMLASGREDPLGSNSFAETDDAAREKLASEIRFTLEHEAQELSTPSEASYLQYYDEPWPPKAKLPKKKVASLPMTPEANVSNDTSSLAQRLWSPIARAAGHAADKVANATYILQAPGILVLALLMLASSGVAFLTLPKLIHGGEYHADQDAKPWFRRPGSGNLMPNTLNFTPRTSDAHETSGFTRPATESLVRHPPGSSFFSPAASSPAAFSQSDFTPWGKPLPASQYLCSGLVVPRKSECILAVPYLEGASSSSFVIRDLSGQPALKVEVEMPDGHVGGGLEQRPAVILHTCTAQEANKAKPSKPLGYCKIEHRSSQHELRDKAHIYQADGSLMATLVGKWGTSGMSYYLSSTRGSMRLSLEGDFQQHAVNIWSESRMLFGDSSPACSTAFDRTGNFWQLRVLANMDVSLLVAALLCAEILESSN
jgi:hypothetical protein